MVSAWVGGDCSFEAVPRVMLSPIKTTLRLSFLRGAKAKSVKNMNVAAIRVVLFMWREKDKHNIFLLIYIIEFAYE